MDKANEALRGFVVSCCQLSGVFEFVETALDLIAQAIEEILDEDGLSPAFAARNDGCSTVCLDVPPDRV